MKNKARFLFFVCAAVSSFADATTISIVNTNAAGAGFNDTTPVASLGADDNPGTTLGAQRLYVFQKAADQWAKLINSNVTIVVNASMVPLTCTTTTATLGSAGPTFLVANFANAPYTGTSYNIAEANALAGVDLNGSADITATFNVNIGTTGCLDGIGWWYGTVPNDPQQPTSSTALLPVVFHELGHGLGFTANVNAGTGAWTTPSNPPIWARYLFDTTTDKTWLAMTNAERATSAINGPFVVWTGARTNKQAGEYLGLAAALLINSPSSLPQVNAVATASFGPRTPSTGVTGSVVAVTDPVGSGTTTDGCDTPLASAASGNIALFDRGTCNFVVKVKNAQNAGAIAVLIANNVADAPAGLGGSDPTITIPTYEITQSLGAQIRSALASGPVNATLGYFGKSATTDGCIRMFAPNPVQSGSSISHFDTSATPDLLMEPAINPSDFNQVDLTLPLFEDIGWSVNKIEDFIYTDAFDPNVCEHVQP